MNCESAKAAVSKTVIETFNEYEIANNLPGTTTTFYFGDFNDEFFPERNGSFQGFDAFHCEYYNRHINYETGRLGEWVKLDGYYSQGYYRMVRRLEADNA